MKKLIISIYLLTGVFVIANSQIKVAEDNNVGIGVTDPVSKLAVGGTGNTYSTLYVENNSTISNQRAANFYKSASGDTGSDYSYSVIGHIVHNGGYKLIGGQFSAHSASTSNNRTFGVRGIAGNG
ncbi:MAG TPA: hypothetical protein ENO05_04815, partial [Bacteroides sp.]|nr:hypothetical protein [Bacteroides sp.]